MATQEEYYKKAYDPLKQSLDRQHSGRVESDDRFIAQYNAAADKAAQTSSAGYQQSIDEAPITALKQKEDNAMREAVNRKIVEESMANMGLTDSGLNRTQQTALTLQRGNADAEVDRQTQDYVNQLKLAIDEVMSEAEASKLANEASLRKETENWYTTALGNLENTAQTSAATMYAAEQDKLAQIEEAQIKADAEKITRSDEYRNDYVANLLDRGNISEEAAWAAGYTRYPGQNEDDNMYYAAYDNAKKAGYDDAYAAAIANVVKAGGREKEINAAINSVAQEKAGKAGLEGIVSLSDGASAFGKLQAYLLNTMGGSAGNGEADLNERYVDMATSWKKDDWTGAIQRMVEIAKKNIEKKGSSLSDLEKEYAVAKAVGKAMADVYQANKASYSDMYDAIGESFSSDLMRDVAVTEAGLPQKAEVTTETTAATSTRERRNPR